MVSCLMGDSTALASAIVRCCPKYRRFQRNAHIVVPDAKKASVWGKVHQ